MKITMPEKVKFIIEQLNNAGFEAYAVGGCVRDSILGRAPKDWDVTTSANPEEVKAIFRRTIDTGIEHGTVTVMLDKEGFEVTTYRIDGKYEDNRHPSEVTFARNLQDDLLRRDFTINAMAYNDTEGIVDLFGGIGDLEEGIIRAVGNPVERFREDALRIMRAVRFAAELGFDIEESTAAAMKQFAPNLGSISAERIRVELQKLIMGPYPEKIGLAVKAGITEVVFPEWNKAIETAQENKFHVYSVADHTLCALKALHRLIGMTAFEKQVGAFEEAFDSEKIKWATEIFNTDFTQKERQMLCLAVMLHDIGKPEVKTYKDGVAHFYKHMKKSAEMAVSILKRLKYDNETINTVKILVENHDAVYGRSWEPGSPCARRLAGKIGLENLRLLIPVFYADAMAHAPEYVDVVFSEIKKFSERYQEICESEQCVSLKKLAVGGKDLMGLGITPGPEIGRILNELLLEVIENPELNEFDTLMGLAKELV